MAQMCSDTSRASCRRLTHTRSDALLWHLRSAPTGSDASDKNMRTGQKHERIRAGMWLLKAHISHIPAPTSSVAFLTGDQPSACRCHPPRAVPVRLLAPSSAVQLRVLSRLPLYKARPLLPNSQEVLPRPAHFPAHSLPD